MAKRKQVRSELSTQIRAARKEELSAARLAANRRNAQHSTGPRTEKGKARSRMNGITHGLFVRDAVIGGEMVEEDAAEFHALHTEWRAALQPLGAPESHLVEMIVHALWAERRARRLEVLMQWMGNDMEWGSDPSNCYTMAIPVQRAAETQRRRWLALKHELERMQARRLGAIPIQVDPADRRPAEAWRETPVCVCRKAHVEPPAPDFVVDEPPPPAPPKPVAETPLADPPAPANVPDAEAAECAAFEAERRAFAAEYPSGLGGPQPPPPGRPWPPDGPARGDPNSCVMVGLRSTPDSPYD